MCMSAVLLNKPNEAVLYFIVPGAVLAHEPEKFTKWFLDDKFPGIHPNTLQQLGFADAWNIFSEGAA